MGVIKRGILGGFSGKVANVVGGSWKGIAYMRALPLSVANPNTSGQVGQRTKFTAIVAIAVAALADIIKPLNDRFAQYMSGYNSFIQRNIDFISTGGVVTWSSLEFSTGSLLNATRGAVNASNGSPTVTIPWTNNSGTGNALATDEVYAVCYNETQDNYGFSSAAAARNAATLNITMPTNCATNDVLHTYLMFRKADGTLVSGTNYSTITV